MSKLKIISYNRKFPKIFEKEKKKISKTTGINNISHIGSTAVPGLGGKGIIDTMIGIKNWEKANSIIKKLKNLGFTHIRPKEKGRIFLSKNRGLSLNNIHIHIVKEKSKQYKDLLSFRDYLRKNKKEVEKFFKLKLKWSGETGGNRKKYGELKESYVRRILKNF